MNWRILIGSSWALLLFGHPPPSLAQPAVNQREPISVGVNLVTLRFTLRDRAGRAINTLAKEQFQIFEGNKAKEIAFFDPPKNQSGENKALWLAFLLDVSGSTFATRSEEIMAAQTFFDNVQDFTRIGIFGFTDKLILFQDFTRTRSLALKALAATRKHLGQTAIYRSIDALISRLNTSRVPSGDRKVVIVISDGMDGAYETAPQTIDLALSKNVILYTVLVPSAAQLYIAPTLGKDSGSPTTYQLNDERQEKEAAFARLSDLTGGEHFSGFETILDFDNILAQINQALFGNLYMIGYYTDHPYRDKTERNIRVAVKQPGLQPSAVFKRVPQNLQAKKNFIAALFENGISSWLSSELLFHEIGAEIDILPSRKEGGEFGLPFRIKVSPHTLERPERGGVRTQLGIVGILTDEEGNEVVRLREIFRVTLSPKELRQGRGVLYTNKLFAPPGVYRLKLVLLEIPSWKMTTFNKAVRIAAQ